MALVDVGLPGMDGFGVASKVREAAAGVVRLVALTGYGLPQDRARAADAGFDRHILKPIEPNALFRVLNEVSPGQDPSELSNSPKFKASERPAKRRYARREFSDILHFRCAART